MKWGRFSGSNHSDYKSSDGKLSGVDVSGSYHSDGKGSRW